MTMPAYHTASTSRSRFRSQKCTRNGDETDVIVRRAPDGDARWVREHPVATVLLSTSATRSERGIQADEAGC